MPIANIYVLNDNLTNTPIQGAVVGIYDTSGNFITSATTNTNGLVSVLLTLPQYHIYVYKPKFTTEQPQLLNVNLSATTITYEITGHLRELPESLDPQRCRISGNMIKTNMAPVKFYTLTLVHDYPYIVNPDIIANVPVNITSDINGYFEFDLQRGTKYKNSFVTDQEACHHIVPNRPSLELQHFLYPIHVSVTIPTTINVNVGETTEVQADILYSDYSTEEERERFQICWSEIRASVANPELFEIHTNKSKVVITGLNPGTTTLTFVRHLKHCLVFKDAPVFSASTTTVTVT